MFQNSGFWVRPSSPRSVNYYLGYPGLAPEPILYETPALKAVNENGDENGSRVP